MTVYPSNSHSLSRNSMSPNALKVVSRLQRSGFEAYLVGGCVRDALLGIEPKDFDVVTNATPEQVKEKFNNCRLIGRRFRLAHVMFGREVIEVATYRGHHAQSESEKDSVKDEQGLLLRDNVYGTIEEDAQRRDFNINAMYYNPENGDVLDFAQGMKAIESRIINLIGDPETRYREDPVRMLRAVRFAAKLDMQLEEKTSQAISELHHLLSNIPPARLFEEVLKLFLAGYSQITYGYLQKYQLFGVLFPQLQTLLQDETSKEVQFVYKVLSNTDTRIRNEQRVTPAFLYAAFLWYPLERRCAELMNQVSLNHYDAFMMAINDVLSKQTTRIMIPKRFTTVIRDIWMLQLRLPKRSGKRPYQALSHPKFRAGYDFLLFRGEVEGGSLLELAQWWNTFQHTSPEKQRHILKKLNPQMRRKRRKPVQKND